MPNLLNKISDLHKRIFVNRVASGSLRVQIERQFSKEIQRALIRLDAALTERLVSEGLLRSMQQQAALISRLPYKQRKPAIADTLNSVFHPGNFRDLKFTDEVRSLANIYRKYAPLLYEMGAVTGLRSFGVKSDSRRLEDFKKRMSVSKAPGLLFELTDEEVIWMLDNRGIQFGQGITEQTIRDARAIIREEVYIKGNSYQAAADRIRKMNGVTPARSLKIARTEAQVAHSTATHDQYVRSGVKKHQWWAVGDRRTREAHNYNDGVTVKIGEPFPSGQIHPGDGALAINCRCTVTPDLSDKNLQLDPWTGGPGGPTSLPGPDGFVPRTITPAQRQAVRGGHKPKPRPKRKPKKKPAKEAQDFEKMRQSILDDIKKDPDYEEYVAFRDQMQKLDKKTDDLYQRLMQAEQDYVATTAQNAERARLAALRKQLAEEFIKDTAHRDMIKKKANELREKFAKKVRKRLRTQGKGIDAHLNTNTGGYDDLRINGRRRGVTNTPKKLQGRIDDAAAFIDDVSSASQAQASPVTAAEQTAAKATADDIAKTLKEFEERIGKAEKVIKEAKDQGMRIPSRSAKIHRHNKVLRDTLRGELRYYEELAKGNRTLKQQNYMRPSAKRGEKPVRAFHSTDYVRLESRDWHKFDILVVDDAYDTGVIVHELVHGIENEFHVRSSRAFLKHRAGGSGMNLNTATMSQRGVGGAREIYFPDEFMDRYQGRLYFNRKKVGGKWKYVLDDTAGVRSTEINTMYMQALYEDPILLMQQDPEGFVYIMETMNGVPLEQQTWFRALSPERRQWVTSNMDEFMTDSIHKLNASSNGIESTEVVLNTG